MAPMLCCRGEGIIRFWAIWGISSRVKDIVERILVIWGEIAELLGGASMERIVPPKGLDVIGIIGSLMLRVHVELCSQ